MEPVHWIPPLVGRRTNFNIIVAGPFRAGKTTIVQQLRTGKRVEAQPTGRMAEEVIKRGDCLYYVTEFGGKTEYRGDWASRSASCDALIFVVDATALREQLEEAKRELHRMLQDEKLKECPCLILANKQDLKAPLKKEDVARRLELKTFPGITWHVAETCVGPKESKGIEEAFEWLQQQLAREEN